MLLRCCTEAEQWSAGSPMMNRNHGELWLSDILPLDSSADGWNRARLLGYITDELWC